MQQRCLCTCAKLQASMKQVGRIISKVMKTDKTKKYFKKPTSYNAPIVFQGPKPAKTTETHQTRRVAVLNQIFMKHITDMMSTGEVAPKLLERGIEVTGVKVSPDFQIVNVMWAAQDKINDDETTAEILKKAAGHLQHELTQLRVIGIVPPINFVKDKHYSQAKDVEAILSQIDFGDDYIPTSHVPRITHAPTLITSLPPEVRERLSKMKSSDEEVAEEDEEYEIQVPEMRQDIMGFDHSAVMHKVKTSLKKSRVAHQNRILNISSETQEPVGVPATSDEVASFLSKKQETALFDDFLKKRLVEEKRRLRARPLLQSKLEDEDERARILNETYDDDLPIDDDKDEYMDSFK